MSPHEQWMPAFGCDAYVVSDCGAVRRVRNGRPVKPCAGRKGYLAVDIGGRQRRINRLVLESFVGPAPSPKHVAAHLDGDNTNNRLSNLAWATATENAAHKRLHGRHVFGERHGQARLTTEQVRAIRLRVAAGESRAALAREAGVCESTIRAVVQRRNWMYA